MATDPTRWLAAVIIATASGCRHSSSAPPGAPAAAETPSSGGAVMAGSQGWWRGQVFYEVFVRSFADASGDGVGDLLGLTARLDYLNDGMPGGDDLGVDALWLMPIHPSPSYHGYDVTDYRGVNPDYGSLADLDALVREAHRRGMRVIIDFVLNHSSSQHPWFVSAQSGPGSPSRDYYLWRSEPLPWGRPWDGAPVWHASNGSYFYGLFSRGMPDLNLGNPAVEREMLEAMRFWLGRGVDGFRVDAARHLFESPDGVLVDQPASHSLVQRLRRALEAEFPHVLFVAEAWTSAETVAEYRGGGHEFQLAFGFDTAAAIKQSLQDGSADALAAAVDTSLRVDGDPGFEAPFLSNHDQARVMRDLAGDVARARLGAAVLLALPGTPFLYYGEELGMQGGPERRDEDKRTPMRWSSEAPGYGFTTAGRTWYGAPSPEGPGVDVASERPADGSLWRLYQRLLALRHATPALQTGVASRPSVVGGGKGVFALLRVGGAGRVLFIANFGAAASGPVSVSVPGRPRVLLSQGLPGAPAVVDGGVSLGGIEPRGFAFVAVE